MRTIGATKFKEQCLVLLEDLGPEGLLITKHGKPAARVLSYDYRCEPHIGSLRDDIEIRGDIVSTGGCWDADAESV